MAGRDPELPRLSASPRPSARRDRPRPPAPPRSPRTRRRGRGRAGDRRRAWRRAGAGVRNCSRISPPSRVRCMAMTVLTGWPHSEAAKPTSSCGRRAGRRRGRAPRSLSRGCAGQRLDRRLALRLARLRDRDEGREAERLDPDETRPGTRRAPCRRVLSRPHPRTGTTPSPPIRRAPPRARTRRCPTRRGGGCGEALAWARAIRRDGYIGWYAGARERPDRRKALPRSQPAAAAPA